jgi:signal transduction histidine kinase
MPRRIMLEQLHDSLLFMLGEELKSPLTTISMLAEQGESESIKAEAARALRTIDNILLYQRVSSEQQSLHLEPLHVGHTLTRALHTLQPLAKTTENTTSIHIQHGIRTITADAEVLYAGLVGIGQAILSLQDHASTTIWETTQTRHGVRIVVRSPKIQLEDVHIAAKTAVGWSRQPFKGLPNAGTDLVTAQGLFGLLGSVLRKTRRQGMDGLVITFRPSDQLTLLPL